MCRDSCINYSQNNESRHFGGINGGIDKKNVVMSYYRDSGAGGQHRNKTMSGVRLQYEGELVECCEGRSQHKNKELAFKRLEERLKNKQIKVQQEKELQEEQSQNENSLKTRTKEKEETFIEIITFKEMKYLKMARDIL